MRKCEYVHVCISDEAWFEQYGPTPANRFRVLSRTLDIRTALNEKMCWYHFHKRLSVYTAVLVLQTDTWKFLFTFHFFCFVLFCFFSINFMQKQTGEDK